MRLTCYFSHHIYAIGLIALFAASGTPTAHGIHPHTTVASRKASVSTMCPMCVGPARRIGEAECVIVRSRSDRTLLRIHTPDDSIRP